MEKRCRNCGSSQRQVVETHLYTECGLTNVALVGVAVRNCSHCGNREALIPRVAELHRVIAHALIRKKARLAGPEVRFLRKYLDWSATMLAAQMGVDPSTVSNWEKGKMPIGPSSDRALRLLVAYLAPVEAYPVNEVFPKIRGDEPTAWLTPEQENEKTALMREMSDYNHDIYHLTKGEAYAIDGVGIFECIAAGAHASPRRWTTTQYVVYQGPSGSFWQLFWDRGNTESQPNEYDNPEPVLVRRVERMVFDFIPVKS